MKYRCMLFLHLAAVGMVPFAKYQMLFFKEKLDAIEDVEHSLGTQK